MMTSSYYELAIIAFIIAVMAYLALRQGQRNPVPTGQLDTQVNAIKQKVDEIEDRVETMEGAYAKASDIKRLEARLDRHEHKMDQLANEVSAIRESMAAGDAQREGTRRQLDLIYQVVVEKGMKS